MAGDCRDPCPPRKKEREACEEGHALLLTFGFCYIQICCLDLLQLSVAMMDQTGPRWTKRIRAKMTQNTEIVRLWIRQLWNHLLPEFLHDINVLIIYASYLDSLLTVFEKAHLKHIARYSKEQLLLSHLNKDFHLKSLKLILAKDSMWFSVVKNKKWCVTFISLIALIKQHPEQW